MTWRWSICKVGALCNDVSLVSVCLFVRLSPHFHRGRLAMWWLSLPRSSCCQCQVCHPHSGKLPPVTFMVGAVHVHLFYMGCRRTQWSWGEDGWCMCVRLCDVWSRGRWNDGLSVYDHSRRMFCLLVSNRCRRPRRRETDFSYLLSKSEWNVWQ